MSDFPIFHTPAMDDKLNTSTICPPDSQVCLTCHPAPDFQSNYSYSASDSSSMQSPSNSNVLSGRSSIDSQLSLPLETSFSSFFFRNSPQYEGKTHSEIFLYRCLKTINCHVGLISCLEVSGDLIFSASLGNDIREWRHLELEGYTRFGNGNGAVKSLVVINNMVISAHQDHKIRVWKRSASKPGGYKIKTIMPTVKDYLSNFVNQNNYVQVRRHHKRLWIEHVDTISCLAVGTKTNVLYSGSWDKTVKVWRLKDFKCIESIEAHSNAINSLVVGPGGILYTASADGSIKAWSKPQESSIHRLVATLEGHKSSVNALTVSSDGSLLYSGGSDRGILAWETELGGSKFNLACKLLGHHLAVMCLSTAGEFLCSGSTDKTIRIWRREPGGFGHSCISVLRGHQGPVKCISVSEKVSSGYFIYSGSLDGSIKLWWVSHNREEDDSSEQNHSQHLLQWLQ